MAVPRPARPTALWQDLRAFLATRQRHQWLIGAVSIAIPALFVAGFYQDSKIMPPDSNPVVYVQSWPADRSDAEIIAQQKIDQAKKDAALEARRQQWKRLDDKLDRLGI